MIIIRILNVTWIVGISMINWSFTNNLPRIFRMHNNSWLAACSKYATRIYLLYFWIWVWTLEAYDTILIYIYINLYKH